MKKLQLKRSTLFVQDVFSFENVACWRINASTWTHDELRFHSSLLTWFVEIIWKINVHRFMVCVEHIFDKNAQDSWFWLPVMHLIQIAAPVTAKHAHTSQFANDLYGFFALWPATFLHRCYMLTGQDRKKSWHFLTYLPLDKMTAISQTIFSYAFSWMKVFYCH